jgi:hypothetical protein
MDVVTVIRRVFLCLIAKISDRFFEQGINKIFYVKLRRMQTVITGDETWRFQYDPGSKRQS